MLTRNAGPRKSRGPAFDVSEGFVRQRLYGISHPSGPHTAPSGAAPPTVSSFTGGVYVSHACSSACVNTSAGCPPEIPYLRSRTKNGTPFAPSAAPHARQHAPRPRTRSRRRAPRAPRPRPGRPATRQLHQALVVEQGALVGEVVAEQDGRPVPSACPAPRRSGSAGACRRCCRHRGRRRCTPGRCRVRSTPRAPQRPRLLQAHPVLLRQHRDHVGHGALRQRRDPARSCGRRPRSRPCARTSPAPARSGPSRCSTRDRRRRSRFRRALASFYFLIAIASASQPGTAGDRVPPARIRQPMCGPRGARARTSGSTVNYPRRDSATRPRVLASRLVPCGRRLGAGQFGATADAEAAEQAGQVALDRLDRYLEGGGDLAVRGPERTSSTICRSVALRGSAGESRRSRRFWTKRSQGPQPAAA